MLCRARFEPNPGTRNTEELAWGGPEAFIDATEFQPARVFTNGVWFPSSFGTEFQVHAGL